VVSRPVRQTPDERNHDAENRDEAATLRDHAAQDRDVRAAGRNHAADARDKAALQRDLAMHAQLHAADLRSKAAKALHAAAEAHAEAAASGKGDAGRLARLRAAELATGPVAAIGTRTRMTRNKQAHGTNAPAAAGMFGGL
jgi:hypothetical protein